MSWDASLNCDACGHTVAEQNYTHNTNGMANAVLDPDYLQRSTFEEVFRTGDKPPSVSWWKQLDGSSGPDGAALLARIVEGLEAEPERFRLMNPDNGWGDYDGLIEALRAMRDAVPEYPTTWSVWG